MPGSCTEPQLHDKAEAKIPPGEGFAASSIAVSADAAALENSRGTSRGHGQGFESQK